MVTLAQSPPGDRPAGAPQSKTATVMLGLARDAKNKMVFAQLEARIAGPHAVWLVTEIQLI